MEIIITGTTLLIISAIIIVAFILKNIWCYYYEHKIMVDVCDGNKSFDSEDHAEYRFYKAVQTTGRNVLYQVLIWGCSKLPKQTFEQYMKDNLGMSNVDLRKSFDSEQRETLKLDVSGNSFDISLIFKCIQKSCKSLAPSNDNLWFDKNGTTLENMITRIKNTRNGFLHKKTKLNHQDFVDKIEKFRYLLKQTVMMAGRRFEKNKNIINECISVLEKELNYISKAPLAHTDIKEYQKDIFTEKLKIYLVTEAPKELIENYSSISEVNPFHFLAGSECHLEVSGIFTYMEVEEAERMTAGTPVTYKSILDLCENSRTIQRVPSKLDVKANKNDNGSYSIGSASVILLEGLAGSGKTTMTKLFMSDWGNKKDEILNLKEYQLLVYMECRNRFITSLSELIASVIPKTSGSFLLDDLEKAALRLKVLILVDGLDELNVVSENVLQELLSKIRGRDITLLCTTRPEKVHHFYRILPSYVKTAHVKILGIPQSKREEFVTKYYDKLFNKIKSNGQSDLDGLLLVLSKLTRVLGDHLRLPLNLVLVTYLWIVAPEKLTAVGTATSLYIALHSLFKEKMMERIEKKFKSDDSFTLENKCNELLKVLCYESLVSLSKDEIILSDEAYKRILSVCNKNSTIICEEIVSAFLVVKTMWTPKGFIKTVSMPHKGLQDFMAAKAVVNMLGKQSKSILNILNDLHNKKSPLNLKKYQNVLYHIPGLMRHDNGLSKARARELIGLFKRAGVRDSDQWLDTLTEMEFHKVMCKHVITHMDDLRIRKDNIDHVNSLLKHAAPKSAAVTIAPDSNSCQISGILITLYGYQSNARLVLFGKPSTEHKLIIISIIKFLCKNNEIVLNVHTEKFIELLKQCELNTAQEWMTLIYETNYNRFICAKVSDVLPKLIINDQNVKENYNFLKLGNPKEVTIVFSTEPNQLLQIVDILKLLTDKTCKVEFMLDSVANEQHYNNINLLLTIVNSNKLLIETFAKEFVNLIFLFDNMDNRKLMLILQKFDYHEKISLLLSNKIDYNKWVITDDIIPSAISLLSYGFPMKCNIILTPTFDNIKLLPNLLVVLSTTNTGVKIALEQHTDKDANKYQHILFKLITLICKTNKIALKRNLNQLRQLVRRVCSKKIATWISYAENISMLNYKTNIIIDDDNLEIGSAILQYGCPQQVIISIKEDPGPLGRLTELLEILQNKSCDLSIYFHFSFQNPTISQNCDLMKSLRNMFNAEKCRLVRFMGVLGADEILLLPRRMSWVFLAISTDAMATSLKHLNNLPFLKDIGIHLSQNISTKVLTPLPSGSYEPPLCHLYISKLLATDTSWATHAAVNLMPKGERYAYLAFPKLGVGKKGAGELLTSLGEAGVDVASLWVSSRHLHAPHVPQLTQQSSELWGVGCCFYLVDDENIWECL